MINLPNFLVIGAYSRNAGKTTFSTEIIKELKGPVTALKVTIIKDDERIACPRGGSGCGVCTSLSSDFEISEELDTKTGKDTSELLAAGAEKVYWLRVREGFEEPGLEAVLKQIPSDKAVICESNSIMHSIIPSLFFLLKSKTEKNKKKSAISVEDKADCIVETSADSSNFDFSKLHFNNSAWSLKS